MEIFFKYIENPAEILIDPNKLLFEEIINDFPFFQTAHLFLVIAKHQTDGIFFSDRDLKNAAIYSGDRAKLYDHLTSKVKSVTEQEKISKYDSEKHFQPSKKVEQEDDQTIKTDITLKKSEGESSTLIDKFLKEKPSIQKLSTEFYSPSKMAMKSITEEEDFVSETLAQIYIKTQSYEKAIKIYQKLSLIYPEKSNYFAEIIKSLLKKLN